MNNGWLVYNFLNQMWEGLWTGAPLVATGMSRLTVYGEERLTFVNGNGQVCWLNDGFVDGATPVADSLTTRIYTCGGMVRKLHLAADMTWDAYAPSITVTAQTPGVNETETLLPSPVVYDPTQYAVSGLPAYVPGQGNFANPYREDYQMNLADLVGGQRPAPESHGSFPDAPGRLGCAVRDREYNGQFAHPERERAGGGRTESRWSAGVSQSMIDTIMKNQYLKILMAVYCIAALMLPPMAWATLSAVVTSGYTFGPSEIPTIATLNELGEPTIQIIGTVDGSTGLTPGSVTGTLLADSVPDGSTLTYNGASPRQLMIAQQGVGSNNIAVLALGAGLLGGNGTPMFLNVDPNYFQLVTNSIANTNSISPSNYFTWVPWLSFVPLSLTDTNISPTLPG